MINHTYVIQIINDDISEDKEGFQAQLRLFKAVSYVDLSQAVAHIEILDDDGEIV